MDSSSHFAIVPERIVDPHLPEDKEALIQYQFEKAGALLELMHAGYAKIVEAQAAESPNLAQTHCAYGPSFELHSSENVFHDIGDDPEDNSMPAWSIEIIPNRFFHASIRSNAEGATDNTEFTSKHVFWRPVNNETDLEIRNNGDVPPSIEEIKEYTEWLKALPVK